MNITLPPVFTLSKLSFLITAFIGSQVYAQTQSSTHQIEEITVTAQKRDQSIQDVPVSISAYDGAFLESLGVAELDMLSDITPGLVIQEQSPNNPGFVIRGITSDSGSSQAAPRVSIYYNGADVSRSRGSYFELFDIERIEVVKGPQATLFGTAASVGALSVITRKPQEEFGAEIKTSIGNYSAETLSGFVTGGNSQVQGRFAFSYRQRDGFIRNIAGEADSQNPDGYDQEDMHGIERTAFRPSLRFTPSEDLTIDLVYTYEKNDDSGTSFKNGLYAPTGGDTSPFSFVEMSGSPVSQSVLGNDGLGVERTVEDINLTLNWDINSQLTFTSITAGRQFDSLEVFDADGTQAWFLEFAEDAQGDQFSQELRIVHQGDKLTTIAGVSYFTEDGSQAVPFSTEESIFLNCLGVFAAFAQPCIASDGSVPILTPVLTEGAAQVLPYSLEFENYGETDAYSAFADVTYAISNALELTAGLRYVREDKTSGYRSDAPASVLTGSELFTVDTDGQIFRAEEDYDDWLPRFNMLYILNEDINMYATISKGRRSDVLNVTSVRGEDGLGERSVTEVPAEIIWNYETGVKGQALDKSVNYNLSVFYQDYSNFQVTLLDDDGVAFAADAGSATNVGAEAEVRALLGVDFEVFANLAYLDATIDDDSTNGNLAGNRFRLQPEWTGSLGMFYATQLAEGYNFTSSLVYSYRSDVFFEPANAPISGLDISEDAVSLVSARIGIAGEEESWAVSLFANNLLDKEYLVDAGNTGGGFGNPTFVAGPPRFYGVEFKMHFGE
ncbi:Colicin I receptor [Paraglaciecola mesophila]|uniref:Colicin I receptor n=1 Tax=Paraglaciecola mesophila TaxID=197222 RepID=A0A857JLC9_9ALTE|nr:TonB-dependent receptor [Paraglaciecola mesophila]QHJ11930.1 Colicin I receptor [Paraglaciecola mesophila]